MGIREDTVKGIAWNSIGTVGSGIVSFTITMILARLLNPSDYGLLELLIIFVAVSETLVNSGFGQALIRDNKANDVDKSTIFYVNVIISVSLYVILFFCAPFIAKFYHEETLVSLSRVVFLVIIIHSLSLIQGVQYDKQLNFKTPAMASIVAMLLAGGTAIVMAFKGFGVWALATNMVLNAFLKMCFLWLLSSWRPIRAFSITSLKKYFSFGGYLLLQGLLDKVVSNLESLVIGKVYTKSDLGYFSQSRRLDSLIVQTSIGVIQKVTYPALSKVGSDPVQLKAGYRKVLGVMLFMMIPTMTFLSVASENIITIIYGAKWLESAKYLKLWAVTGICIATYSIYMNILLVKGRSKLVLALGICRHVLRICVIVFLVKIGIMVLLQGIVVVTGLYMIAYMYFGGRQIDYSIWDAVKDNFQLVLASVLGAFLIVCIGKVFQSLPLYLEFVLQIVLMGVTYLFVLFVCKNWQMREVMDIIKGLIFKKNK